MFLRYVHFFFQNKKIKNSKKLDFWDGLTREEIFPYEGKTKDLIFLIMLKIAIFSSVYTFYKGSMGIKESVTLQVKEKDNNK